MLEQYIKKPNLSSQILHSFSPPKKRKEYYILIFCLLKIKSHLISSTKPPSKSQTFLHAPTHMHAHIHLNDS